MLLKVCMYMCYAIIEYFGFKEVLSEWLLLILILRHVQ